MRRSIAVAGLAAGLVIIFTSASILKAQSDQRSRTLLKSQYDQLERMTFCEKGYLIASAYPDTINGRYSPEARAVLNQYVDFLNELRVALTNHLENDFREKAIKSGIAESMYDSILDQYRRQAEIKASQTFEAAPDPDVVLRRLNGMCHLHLRK